MNYANAGQSTLLNAIAAGDLSLTVVDGTPFPAAPFHIVIDTELMLVTNSVSGTFTVTRAIEGTTAAAHIKGAVVTCCVTAADLAAFLTSAVTSFNTRTGAVTLTSTDVFGVLAAGTNITLTNSGGVVTIASTGGGGGGDRWVTLTNAPVAVSGAFSIVNYDTEYVCTVTTAFTITLPAASAGKMVAIRVAPSSIKLLTVDAGVGVTIDGVRTRLMWSGEKAELLSDGANWFKVAGITIPMIALLAVNPADVAQTPANNTITQVLIDDSVIDNTGLMNDTVNHQINIIRDGLYVCACTAVLQITAGTSQNTQVRLNKNGSVTALSLATIYYPGTGISFGGPFVQAPLTLAVNDTLTYSVFQNSGGNATLNLGSAGQYNCYLAAIEQPAW